MKEILKLARANVYIRDKESGLLIFKDSNLFVDSGRVLIADVLRGAVSMNPIYFVCDLGDDATVPETDDIDLVSYVSPLSIAVNYPTYPSTIAGEPTGIAFQFEFDNTGYGGDKTIRELGLFYRANSSNFPLRGDLSSTMIGPMLSRLRTTYSSIVIGDTRTITIDWKILF